MHEGASVRRVTPAAGTPCGRGDRPAGLGLPADAVLTSTAVHVRTHRQTRVAIRVRQRRSRSRSRSYTLDPEVSGGRPEGEGGALCELEVRPVLHPHPSQRTR